ncbi:ELL-associated factor 2 [Salvia hispanica]|uniref:ELL-associated factor 2 n=1 Tax=Salvia hispanica TaxID=49212 RepID=UPI0020099B8A|nr:ELL-associated factor 2 [Salvia hispanica]XP_047968522.1 ELL-associated factor 2 [Salvia hispanica]XP_047968523.1 ELL-associated factor 2 [Salvia hispanica]
MTGMNHSSEPSTAPQADQWYNITLGSSFHDHNPSKFCTFRYEFKPASIDKNQRGTLHKNKDNKVSVEFQNIQPGKPKVTFEGTSEDCKDNDAVLFFDGESFRLERVHRAVKRLRHNRKMGEYAGPGPGPGVASVGVADASSPLIARGIKHQPLNKDPYPALPVEVERIEIGNFKCSDAKPRPEKAVQIHVAQPDSSNLSPELKIDDQDEEDLDIMNVDEDDGNAGADGGTIEVKELDFDIIPHQTDTDEDIVDIDISDDGGDKEPNAAEALGAQVNAEAREGQTSSSSSSSGSDSSGSGSGSGSRSSSDSESSDADSVTSI